jgi:hypothetical protein
MSRILSHSPDFTERLITRLRGQEQPKVGFGDFVAVCTDKAGDQWELFPIRGLSADGEVLAVEGEVGGTLAMAAINERPSVVIGVPAHEYPEPAALRAVSWIPFTGLATLRIRLAQLRGHP